ncbi:uncharacterized protein EAE97_008276 [Botrytis byssoidea]|uniref:Uncharacterized protein n=1 Tax=Botrytis byssoidea TaxID=139641 RepID=A0A9P5LQJ6_9HELO|nr:uncharacterized protein EAE97_008276 [Botrytis byssoidea]KAF7935369.1 hypothetical protein EAE97_008276 [Botrytis byssoidea]
MKRELAIHFPKGVPPLRAYFHPVFFRREPGPPRMGDMISMSPEFDAEPIPSVTETTYNNIYLGRDPLQQAMVPRPLPAIATPATLRSQLESAFQSLPKHAAVRSLKDYIAPPIPPNIFDQVCHRGFPDLTIEELQRDLVPFDGHYDWRFRWPDIFSELFVLQNTLWARDFIKSQENCQVCWITRTVEMQKNLPPGAMLYPKIKYYRENPYEVPENCRALVIAEGRKRGEIPDSGYYQPTNKASGSGYSNYPTYDDGSTSGYGADHYGQSIYQPSGSGNVSYTRDQPAVNDTSGTNNYQPSGFNQYPYPSGGSGYNKFAAGGQQYDHGNEKADGSYSDVNTSEPNIITAEPQHQERIPAPRDSTASGSRSSRKGKGRSYR